MKKILFATTALVLGAGAAAADVKVSGDGRMGVVYNGEEAHFASRVRVRFDLSGETDGGLAFGGWIRAHDSYRAGSSTNGGGDLGSRGSVFISGAFGKLEMGRTISASEAAVGDLSAVGYLDGFGGNNYGNVGGAQDYEETPFLVGDGVEQNKGEGSSLLYTYKYDAFGFYASLSDGYNASDVDVGQAWSLGASWSNDMFALGVGYAERDGDHTGSHKATEVSVSAAVTFDALTLKAVYLDQDHSGWAGLDKFWGLSADYKFGATTLTANYTMRDNRDNGGEDQAYGIGAAYDLGGGATLAAGIAQVDYESTGFDETVADFGVKFKF